MVAGPANKRLIAVGGGKGGVGKSIVAANLSVSLARAGAEVVVVDADLGAPNLHTLLGVAGPSDTIESFLDGTVGSLDDIAMATGVARLKLISGTQQVLGAANPSFQLKQKLIRHIAKLRADCIVIDIGAGVDFNTVDFFNAADIRLVVVTPEVTSLENAYGFLKIALYRRLQRMLARGSAAERLRGAMGKRALEIASSMEKMSTFLTVVDSEVPELGPPIRMMLREYSPKLVGNMLVQPSDRNVIYALQRMIKQFLGLDADVVATLRASNQVRASVNQGRPVALGPGSDFDSTTFAWLAKELLSVDIAPLAELRGQISEALTRAGGNDAAAFGLESMEVLAALASQEVPQASEPDSAPPDAPDASGFARDLGRLSRGSERIKTRHPVEIEVGGARAAGTLVEVNDAGGCIEDLASVALAAGVGAVLRAEIAADTGAAAERIEIAVTVKTHDEAGGRTVVKFDDDAAAAPLVVYLRAIPTGGRA